MHDGAEATTIAPPLVLSVDNDNDGVIRLYERLGFDCWERNDHFCVMIERALLWVEEKFKKRSFYFVFVVH